MARRSARVSSRLDVRALHRPGRRAVPARRAVAVHREARALRDRRLRLGRGVARRRRRGSARTATCGHSATIPGARRSARPRRPSALVHLRRPSRLSTLTLPDTQPFDDPAGRFAFSHNGDLRDYKGLRATYRAAGRIHGRADTEVGARWLEDEWRPDVPPGAPAGGAPRPVRRPGQPRGPGRRRDAAPLRGQRREPGLRLPAGPHRHRVDRDLLARSVALPVRRPGRHGAARWSRLRTTGRHSARDGRHSAS